MRGPCDNESYPDAQCLEKVSLYKLAQTWDKKRK